ncbi:MAG: S-methyl thiohydantoin desulfurase domain-containing protein, partial [Devosia sp.]
SGLNSWTGSEAQIAIQNENLVLWIDGVARVVVPDLIMNLELDTGEPITTEILRYGQRVAVIGLPVHELMKTPEALEVVGPKAFGYPDLTFTPLVAGGER